MIGGALLGCGFALGGFALVALQQQRVACLQALGLMLSILQGRLRYLCPPVDVLLESLCSNASLQKLLFLPDCLEALRGGTPFAAAWTDAIHRDALLRSMPETASLLSSLSATLGAVDVQGQLDYCAQIASQLEMQLQRAEQRLARNSRLFPPLGLLLGAFAALMLIY